MIGGSVTEKGIKLSQIRQELTDYGDSMFGYIERIALVARGFISERLEVHLGTSAEHFSVTIRPNSFHGYTIMVDPADEVGVFLFKGTEPHEIRSENPMPLGNGQFATVVQHPGMDSKRDLVEKAVFEGIIAAMEVV